MDAKNTDSRLLEALRLRLRGSLGEYELSPSSLQ